MTAREANPRAALVTGGAVRLGKAIAMRLAEEGYDIALHYGTSSEAAVRTQAEIRAMGTECLLFPHDLSDAAGIDAFMGRVRDAMPHVRVLVNSASRYTAARIMDTSIPDFDSLLDINLRAPFFAVQAFARRYETGCIVNVVDNKVGFHQFEYAAYVLSKKALAEFTSLAALELSPRIRVNAVAPGVVLPADTRSARYIDWRVRAIPLAMQGNARHITDGIMFLIQNDFVTGQMLTIDGGENILHLGRNASRYEEDAGKAKGRADEPA